MTTAAFRKYADYGLGTQSSADVARVVAGVAAGDGLAGQRESGEEGENGGVSGEAIYVEASKAWTFETEYYESMPAWLGKEPADLLQRTVAAVKQVGLFRFHSTQLWCDARAWTAWKSTMW